MRMLFLTPYLPSPPRTGGARRLHALMRGLARAHHVSVLSQVRAGTDVAEAVAATLAYCHEVVTVPNTAFAAHGPRKRRLQLRSLASTRSFEHRVYHYPAYQAALDELLAHNRYDLIVVEFSIMAYYRLPRGPLLVLDEHNIEYEIHARTARTDTQPHRRLYSAVNFLKLRREERAAWRRFDGCVLTSECDQRTLLRDFPGARTRVVPNGVDSALFQPSATPPRNDVILFFGAIDYYPNTQGLLYFLTEIWPTLHQRRPALTLMIVGQSPPPSILAYQGNGVVVTGVVDDIRSYIAEAAVVIVPLQIGGGTRLKILEAMSMEKAIVSTSLGAEGIDVTDGRNILIADRPGDFAARVEEVLADRARREALGREARALITIRYEWDVAVQTLNDFFRELQGWRADMPVVARRLASSS
ncbi:MAG TPA: glycosyltransferase family 4 protein [Thermomicrobiaceae bacterium]|nr:glycosyltransferase family 4 protein [Thermomicrobiaceae bacterium]